MVCTTIRPTKLCYADTNTWQGIGALVSDYFDYEPLTKPMLHVSTYFLLFQCERKLSQVSKHFILINKTNALTWFFVSKRK